jgi:hypothetical protein
LVLVESHEGALEVVDHIIDVGFDQIILNLISKALLDSTLVHGPRILKPERHSHVAVGTERCNKGRLDLVVLIESDLVITRVAIEKRQ